MIEINEINWSKIAGADSNTRLSPNYGC
jgi:hypothetical protein